MVDNAQGNYNKSKRPPDHRVPRGASEGWPNFRCVNGCGFTTEPESEVIRCPNCNAPLVRSIRFEQKVGPSAPQ